MSPSIKFPDASAGIWPVLSEGSADGVDTGAVDEAVCDDGLGVDCHCWGRIFG